MTTCVTKGAAITYVAFTQDTWLAIMVCLGGYELRGEWLERVQEAFNTLSRIKGTIQITVEQS